MKSIYLIEFADVSVFPLPPSGQIFKHHTLSTGFAALHPWLHPIAPTGHQRKEFSLLPKHSLNKLLRIKRLDVVNPLTEADIFHRHVQLIAYPHHDPALR